MDCRGMKCRSKNLRASWSDKFCGCALAAAHTAAQAGLRAMALQDSRNAGQAAPMLSVTHPGNSSQCASRQAEGAPGVVGMVQFVQVAVPGGRSFGGNCLHPVETTTIATTMEAEKMERRRNGRFMARRSKRADGLGTHCTGIPAGVAFSLKMENWHEHERIRNPV